MEKSQKKGANISFNSDASTGTVFFDASNVTLSAVKAYVSDDGTVQFTLTHADGSTTSYSATGVAISAGGGNAGIRTTGQDRIISETGITPASEEEVHAALREELNAAIAALTELADAGHEWAAKVLATCEEGDGTTFRQIGFHTNLRMGQQALHFQRNAEGVLSRVSERLGRVDSKLDSLLGLVNHFRYGLFEKFSGWMWAFGIAMFVLVSVVSYFGHRNAVAAEELVTLQQQANEQAADYYRAMLSKADAQKTELENIVTQNDYTINLLEEDATVQKQMRDNTGWIGNQQKITAEAATSVSNALSPESDGGDANE